MPTLMISGKAGRLKNSRKVGGVKVRHSALPHTTFHLIHRLNSEAQPLRMSTPATHLSCYVVPTLLPQRPVCSIYCGSRQVHGFGFRVPYTCASEEVLPVRVQWNPLAPQRLFYLGVRKPCLRRFAVACPCEHRGSPRYHGNNRL